MSKNEWKEETVEFTDWANGGSALGRLADGRAVFTPGVLPGEKAVIRFQDKEARFIAADLVRLLKESPMRIKPRCPLYGSCFGCQLQHLEYPDQLHAKREILIDHLTRIAGLPNAANLTLPMLPVPEAWNYSRLIRLWLDTEGNFCLPDRKGNALRLEAFCPITAECINDALASFTFEGDNGIREMEFRADDEDGIQLILKGDADQPENEMENETEISVVYQGPESSYVMAGVSTLRQTAAGLPVCASDNSPFMRNPAIFEKVCEKLSEFLSGFEEISLLDVHCGTGFWSLWFGKRCHEVNALMEDETFSEDFVYNLDELDNISLYIGELQEVLPGLPIPEQEWIFIEGGNSGLNEADLTALCARSPKKIIYLGNDAAILARDLKRLVAHGRAVEAILPFDPAPQTADLAAIAIL